MNWLDIELCSLSPPLTPYLSHFPFYFPFLVFPFSGLPGLWRLYEQTCLTMSAVVLEMLCHAEEVGFPDMITVMRSLSTDSGMPTLPPGGGLASKYVTSKESNIICYSTV